MVHGAGAERQLRDAKDPRSPRRRVGARRPGGGHHRGAGAAARRTAVLRGARHADPGHDPSRRPGGAVMRTAAGAGGLPPLTGGGRRPPLTKDTRLCISLASRPSNIGTRFHNYLYDMLGLDFVYKAFTTTDIAAAIGGVRALGIR